MHQITEKVALLEAITGYSFTDKRRGASALFTYNAYCPDFGEPTSIKKNDELAIYGDAVLRRHLCEKWLEKGLSKSKSFPGWFTCPLPNFLCLGEWNQIIQQTSSNANLASVGRAHGLGGCIVLNPGTTVVTDKMIATAMEAIIGAVSLDGGSNAVNRLLNALDLSHNLLRVVMSKFFAYPLP